MSSSVGPQDLQPVYLSLFSSLGLFTMSPSSPLLRSSNRKPLWKCTWCSGASFLHILKRRVWWTGTDYNLPCWCSVEGGRLHRDLNLTTCVSPDWICSIVFPKYFWVQDLDLLEPEILNVPFLNSELTETRMVSKPSSTSGEEKVNWS